MKLSLLLSLATASLVLNCVLANDLIISNQTGKNLVVFAQTNRGTAINPESILAHNSNLTLSSDGIISLILVCDESAFAPSYPESQGASFDWPSNRVLIANAVDQHLYVVGANSKRVAKNDDNTIGAIIPKGDDTIKAIMLEDSDGIELIILSIPEDEATAAKPADAEPVA